jgi:hypothetical protein
MMTARIKATETLKGVGMERESNERQEPAKTGAENKPHGLGTLLAMIALVIAIAILASKCPFDRM